MREALAAAPLAPVALRLVVQALLGNDAITRAPLGGGPTAAIRAVWGFLCTDNGAEVSFFFFFLFSRSAHSCRLV